MVVAPMILLRTIGLTVAALALVVAAGLGILLRLPDRWGARILRADDWLCGRIAKLERDRKRAAWCVLFGERYRK